MRFAGRWLSDLGGKADMTICGISAFAVAIGGKADMAFAPHMSAYDPKRTLASKLPYWRIPIC
jgi:hypothetical protein